MITVTTRHFRPTDPGYCEPVGESQLTTILPKVALDALEAAHDNDDVSVRVDHTFNSDQGCALLRARANNFGL